MINIPQLIAGFVARFLDALKIDNQRWFAAIGSFIVAIESILLSNVLPFAVPTLVVETVVAIAALFINSRSFNLATGAVPVNNESLGSWLDKQLALLVEKFKANSLTAFAIVQATFIGLKFYLVTDTNLGLPALATNLILSIIMLFTAPRTKPIISNLEAKKAKIAGK